MCGCAIQAYLQEIDRPMDFQNLRNAVETGSITSWTEFVSTARLIFDNCHRFNCVGSRCAQICRQGRALEEVCNQLDREARQRHVQRLRASRTEPNVSVVAPDEDSTTIVTAAEAPRQTSAHTFSVRSHAVGAGTATSPAVATTVPPAFTRKATAIASTKAVCLQAAAVVAWNSVEAKGSAALSTLREPVPTPLSAVSALPILAGKAALPTRHSDVRTSSVAEPVVVRSVASGTADVADGALDSSLLSSTVRNDVRDTATLDLTAVVNCAQRP